jgi:NNP family nitrate/nitrite transporter-like MFS transporter
MAKMIENWNVEDEQFWESTGKKIAWKTLWITTFALIFSFSTWFVMSAIVVKLPGLGFTYTKDQLFWLAAMPGLAAGILRIIHTFLLPIYGTRKVISVATLLKLIPVIGIGFAVMDPTTPFWLFMVLAFTAGFGGGDFSSFMPSTSLFFPKRLKGTALGIQAGIGNFGVSVVQFVTPLIIGIGTYGAAATFTAIDTKEAVKQFTAMDQTSRSTLFLSLDSLQQTKILANAKPKMVDSVSNAIGSKNAGLILAAMPAKAQAKALSSGNPKLAAKVISKIDANSPSIKNKQIYIQSASFWFVPFLILLTIIAWFYLKSIPINASFKEQLDIFSNKHTWFCTVTYVMTFGTFAGLSAAFPLMIKVLYGDFPNAPDPLAYAFYGPLIGASSRVLFGFVADKIGGAILTTLTGVGIIVGSVLLVNMHLVAPTSMEQFPMFVAVMLGIFFFTGVGNAGTFRQYPIIFAENQRQAAGVIGWTAAIAAFGPFIFNSLIGNSIKASGGANAFFYGLIAFSVIATVINWNFYNKKGCEKPS